MSGILHALPENWLHFSVSSLPSIKKELSVFILVSSSLRWLGEGVRGIASSGFKGTGLIRTCLDQEGCPFKSKHLKDFVSKCYADFQLRISPDVVNWAQTKWQLTTTI